MKEKVRAAPKELVRRRLDDGTERLRGQLRETAQHGQASDYGGDRIEDAAARGAYQARRGVEALLKKKKFVRDRLPDGDRIEDAAARGAYQARRGVEALLKKKKFVRDRLPDEEPHTPESPAPPEAPSELPLESSVEPTSKPQAGRSPEFPSEPSSPYDPPTREQPRIKTREAVSAREGGTRSPESGKARLSPGERMRQIRIKTRESVVHDPRPDVPPAPQAGSEPPQIRTREAAVHDVPADIELAPQVRSEPPKIKTREVATDAPTDHRMAEPSSDNGQAANRLTIKTWDAYIQSQPATTPEQQPQALVQGKQEFMQERGRTAAIKRTEAQRVGNGTVPQAGNGGETASPAPVRCGYTGGQGRYAPAQTVRKPVSPGEPDTRPIGRTIIKTARSGRKTAERTAKQTIKTADLSSRKAIKTTQRAAKTAQQTVKTAQATVKATQRAVQTARATAKAAAKATVVEIKAAIAAMQELIAAIAAGGWVVLVVVLVICMIGLLIASPFGIFFADGSSPDAVSPTEAIVQINGEYADTLSGYQTGGSYDSVEIIGRPPSWADVFAVFTARTAGGDNGASVAVLGQDTVEKLREVFWDMTKITTAEADIEHPAEGDTPAWTETVLTITVTPRTPDDMRVFYAFTEQQNAALDELLTTGNQDMWNSLLYGSSGEIVAVALSQVGNVGGQPYWSWYGFNSRVEWCACFVSWCANECGYIDAGVIPKFAGCTGGSNWFEDRGQWQDGSYEPRPGDLIFFDWDEKGSSGPQDNVPDHVGIVERVENGVVYTVEGNSSDSCHQRNYAVGHYEIWGYGCPIY